MLTNREIFDQIAQSWYGYRHHTRFRAELEVLAGRWRGGTLLNAGCGHGADFLPFKHGFDLYGCDFSVQMLLQAQRYAVKYDFSVDLIQADLSALPYGDNTFDFAISIAAYHHIRGRENALGALVQLRRVLKPGAEAYITVWNKLQPRFWLRRRDAYLPWKTKEHIYLRYYYLYDYAQISRLVRRAGFEIMYAIPESSYKFPLKYFSRNICLLARAL
ncbi:MAG TPA: methyltransferase domain-containing protein [Dehalococcoidia bacterium]|nr:methyltransferase domain-containing protein [Dehalococcoidia bacterium]